MSATGLQQLLSHGQSCFICTTAVSSSQDFFERNSMHHIILIVNNFIMCGFLKGTLEKNHSTQ